MPMAPRALSILLAFVISVGTLSVAAAGKGACQFARSFNCEDFHSQDRVDEYLHNVMKWEGQFAQPGIGYDAQSGYTYDGHPIDYKSGELSGDPHLFSAPSKESIHVSMLALAINGDKYAQQFAGGLDKALDMLRLKMDGYNTFNRRFPGFGCFTPWVGFDSEGFSPLESWSTPYYKVPGLDNGEWFWALYAVADVLTKKYSQTHPQLAADYRQFVECQQRSAKDIFYRGNGDVSATVYIRNASAPVSADNYLHCDGYLNDPYEGETMTQLLYLFADFSADEAEQLWSKKRGLFQKVDYTAAGRAVTVQKGWWFSSHEQWKTLLMPYLSDDLPLVRKVFRNAEVVRTMDAALNKIPGLMASINDVTNGSQEIPDYASACGVASVAFEKIDRRDLLTPYGAYGVFLHDRAAGFCWYNTMLQGPRMQNKFGSTEAINANATEISPLTTWDSKITTVLAMLGGIGDITAAALKSDKVLSTGKNAYEAFVEVVAHEHRLLFGTEDEVLGGDTPMALPSAKLAHNLLADWDIQC